MKDQQAKQQQQAAAASQAQETPQEAPNDTPQDVSQDVNNEQAEDENIEQPEEPIQQESEDESESEEDSESEEESEDDLEELYRLLVGKKINDQGNVIDKKSGTIIGRLVEGKVPKVVGRKVGEHGAIVNSKGKTLGRVEPVDDESSSEEDDSDSEDEEEELTAPASKDNDGEISDAPADEDEEDAPIDGLSKSREISNVSKDSESESEDTVEDVAEKAEYMTEDATEKAEGGVEDTSEKADAAAEEVQDGADDIAKKTEDGVEEATDKAEEFNSDTEREVGDLDVGDKAKDAALAGTAAAVGGAAGTISSEDKPLVNEDSPVVKKSGKVLDMDDNLVGHVDKRLASKFAGFKVDEEGNVIDNDGEIVGTADMIKPVEEENPFNPNEMVDQDSPEVKKSGKVVDMEDNVVGSVDKRLAPKLVGFKVDVDGNVINHEGHIVAKAEMIKIEEPVEREPIEEDKPFNPNEMITEESPEVKKSGKIVDMEDNIVGSIDKRVAIKFAGYKVDPEGNVIDDEGHIVAKAEMLKEEKLVEEDKPFNPNEMVNEDSPEVKKSGKVLDMEDNTVGTADKRMASKYAGCKVDPEGNVIDEEGDVVGKAEMIQAPVEEENPFNPYAMVDENSPEVKKSGKVVDMDDNIVGSVDKLIAHKLIGFKVDSEGNIISNEGHIAGKADMIKQEESEEEEDKPFNPNSMIDENSPEVRRSGKVIDEDDNIAGTVDKGSASRWVGLKVDPYGNVINEEGHTVGKAEMVKKMTDEERKQQEEDDEYRRIAELMSQAVQQSLDKIKPVLKQITDNIEAEEAKSEKDRDEQKLVETVKPLIEQGSQILGEANGAIRGIDPSGKIAKQAQARTSERKALPEEYHLADLLSQLAGEVSTTIDKAKKKIKNMPHAKKELSPLWNILQSPLLQILSAVGLLLTGVLGLVGNILNGLGLGSIINSLLGGIGLNKILEGFGLGDALKLGRK